MKKSLRRTLLDEAGRLRELKSQRSKLEEDRRRVSAQLETLERQILEAQRRFDTTYEQISKAAERTGATQPAEDEALTRGKLPHRILDRMRRDPSRIYTAAELAAELGVKDVQQIRTALARLVNRELVRRTDVRGEFTL